MSTSTSCSPHVASVKQTPLDSTGAASDLPTSSVDGGSHAVADIHVKNDNPSQLQEVPLWPTPPSAVPGRPVGSFGVFVRNNVSPETVVETRTAQEIARAIAEGKAKFWPNEAQEIMWNCHKQLLGTTGYTHQQLLILARAASSLDDSQEGSLNSMLVEFAQKDPRKGQNARRDVSVALELAHILYDEIFKDVKYVEGTSPELIVMEYHRALLGRNDYTEALAQELAEAMTYLSDPWGVPSDTTKNILLEEHRKNRPLSPRTKCPAPASTGV